MLIAKVNLVGKITSHTCGNCCWIMAKHKDKESYLICWFVGGNLNIWVSKFIWKSRSIVHQHKGKAIWSGLSWNRYFELYTKSLFYIDSYLYVVGIRCEETHNKNIRFKWITVFVIKKLRNINSPLKRNSNKSWFSWYSKWTN